MNRLLLPSAVLVVLSIAAGPATGQGALPERLLSAQTILLVNDTGDASEYDVFHNELTKWGRFTVGRRDRPRVAYAIRRKLVER